MSNRQNNGKNDPIARLLGGATPPPPPPPQLPVGPVAMQVDIIPAADPTPALGGGFVILQIRTNLGVFAFFFPAANARETGKQMAQLGRQLASGLQIVGNVPVEEEEPEAQPEAPEPPSPFLGS